jgi:hypothetical protein
MIFAVDVDYREGKAVAAGIAFNNWEDHMLGVWKKLKQKMDERHIKRCPNIGHEKSKH